MLELPGFVWSWLLEQPLAIVVMFAIFSAWVYLQRRDIRTLQKKNHELSMYCIQLVRESSSKRVSEDTENVLSLEKQHSFMLESFKAIGQKLSDVSSAHETQQWYLLKAFEKLAEKWLTATWETPHHVTDADLIDESNPITEPPPAPDDNAA